MWNGYAMLVAIVFRVLWGFFGGSTARFAQFVAPWKALTYLPSLLRIPGTKYLGHNPAGGLWIRCDPRHLFPASVSSASIRRTRTAL